MKNKKSIAQREKLTQPSNDNLMYNCVVAEESLKLYNEGVSVRSTDILYNINETDSEGKEEASAVGCNPDNANASARTLNSNNALSNGNSNYAGAFAVKSRDDNNGNSFPSQATSLNTTDNFATIGVQGYGEYESLPYWDSEKAESGTNASEGNILDELKIANQKRKLKNLKRFFVNREIVEMGVNRCLSHAAKTDEVEYWKQHKEEIIDRIIKELSEETYCSEQPTKRIIGKKDGKKRNATIYSVYDRCVQNIILIIIEYKIRNCISRHCYSGVPERSLFSNNKKYCMTNKIRNYVKRHPNATVGLTDIRHFYDTFDPKVVFGSVMNVVTCRFTRWLLSEVLFSTNSLPIGGTLSQILAMFTLTEMDDHIIKKFHPQFYGAFGDNRIIMDDNSDKIKAIVHYEMSYLEGRFGLEMKNDWQIRPVKYGFRFCKYDYIGSFVHIRSSLKRKIIKSYSKGLQHYAGYKGILEHTDSKKLQYLIQNNLKELKMKNSKGMGVRKMIGDLIKINNLVGRTIVVTDWTTVLNDKDSKYYIKFQLILIGENGNKTLHICNNGSLEIKEYFSLVEQGKAKIGVPLKVCQEGMTFYFEGYHTTKKEALDLLCEKFNIA